jgi:aminoglycoside 6-adenylyltransferase
MSYEEIEQRFAAWGMGQAAVRAAVVVGSRARPPGGSHPPDSWSDLDLILFTTDPGVLARQQGWLAEMGEIWLAVSGSTGRGDPEWDVVFAGGLKVDLVLVETPPEPASTLRSWLEVSPYRSVLARGVRVLFDKTLSGPGLPQFLLEPAAPPSQGEFDRAVSQGLLAAFNAARFLLRGETWRFRQQLECTLRGSLLEMLEWHARLVGGPQADTWYGGRFLAEWADPRVAALEARGSPQQELAAALALFRQLARETALMLSYSYPDAEDERVASWIEKTLRPGAPPEIETHAWKT